MFSYGLKPTFYMCSRVTLHSNSLLGTIFVNMKYDYTDVIFNCVSDHFGVLLLLESLVFVQLWIYQNKFPHWMDAKALNIFRRKLNSTRFDFLESSDLQVNGKFSLWHSKITKLLKEIFTVIPNNFLCYP